MISTAPVMPKNSWIKTVVKIAQVKRELMMREGLILRRVSNSRKDRWLFYKKYLIDKNKMRKNDLSSSAGFTKEASRVTLINENWSAIPGDISSKWKLMLPSWRQIFNIKKLSRIELHHLSVRCFHENSPITCLPALLSVAGGTHCHPSRKPRQSQST